MLRKEPVPRRQRQREPLFGEKGGVIPGEYILEQPAETMMQGK